MFGHGKCPKCEKSLDHVDIDAISAGDKMSGPLHHAISYVCPFCKTILGVAIDPISLKVDTVREILQGLGVKPKGR